MNRLKLAALGALLAAGIAAHGTAEAGPCHAIFVAGEGVVDSCTGKHRDYHPDPPPEPTIIYVDITFAPNISVNVSNVVTSTSVSTSTSSAGAGASANNTKYVVKPRIKRTVTP